MSRSRRGTPKYPTLYAARSVIDLVNWSGGGGHFVVIDKITMKDKHLKMCVCDPWDGDVHVIGAPLGGAMP